MLLTHAPSVDLVTSEPTTAAELPPESAGVRVVFTQLQIALHTLVAALLVLTLVGAHSDASGVLNVPAAATAAVTISWSASLT